jgi:hypothetical protein
LSDKLSEIFPMKRMGNRRCVRLYKVCHWFIQMVIKFDTYYVLVHWNCILYYMLCCCMLCCTCFSCIVN